MAKGKSFWLFGGNRGKKSDTRREAERIFHENAGRRFPARHTMVELSNLLIEHAMRSRGSQKAGSELDELEKKVKGMAGHRLGLATFLEEARAHYGKLSIRKVLIIAEKIVEELPGFLERNRKLADKFKALEGLPKEIEALKNMVAEGEDQNEKIDVSIDLIKCAGLIHDEAMAHAMGEGAFGEFTEGFAIAFAHIKKMQ